MRNKNISCAPALTWRQHWKALCGLRGCKNNELANRLTFATVNCQMPKWCLQLLSYCWACVFRIDETCTRHACQMCSPSACLPLVSTIIKCLYGQWALLVWGQKDRALFIKVLPLKSDWSTWSESLTTNSHNDSIQFLQGCKSPGAWPMWLSVCSVPTTVGLRPALFATWPHIMVRVSPYLTPYYDCGKHLTTVKYPDRGKQIAYYGSTWKNNLQSSVISVQSIAHIVRALEL